MKDSQNLTPFYNQIITVERQDRQPIQSRERRILVALVTTFVVILSLSVLITLAVIITKGPDPEPLPPQPETSIPPLPSNPVAGERYHLVLDGIDYAFRWCPPGEFTMGSPQDELTEDQGAAKHRDDEKSHVVKISRGFWMLETEVTQKMWQNIMGGNPSKFTGEQNPVENVSWDQCQEFCQKLTQRLRGELGVKMQLPTEAQWEYACRAGTSGPYAGDLDKMAWYSSNSESKPHEVGKKTPNEWDLYDMHGNVWEWCSDWYDEKYYSNSPIFDPQNTTDSKDRLLRGGCWNDRPDHCRAAIRYKAAPDQQESYIGLRIVFAPAPPKLAAGDRRVFNLDGIDYAFRWCPPGECMIGSPADEQDRHENEKQHPVTILRGFWLLETEVTQEMWENLMGANLSKLKAAQNPVENVSWDDCQNFCQILSQKLGVEITLPTENQWEYACRAGTTEPFAGDLDSMAWFCRNSDSHTHEVGKKKPNAWGLYDMHGNVFEWCSDWYDPNYADNLESPPESMTSTSKRVYRGGCWRSSISDCRSAHRGHNPSDKAEDNRGLRVLFVPDEEEAEEQANGPQPGDKNVWSSEGIEYIFRWCPPGEFLMGSPTDEQGRSEDEQQHKVKITQGFWILETEVTQKMWKSVMGKLSWSYRKHMQIHEQIRDDFPIVKVDRKECNDFCKKLSEKLGVTVKLPTEAQWEYACRAGTSGPYADNLDSMAWYNKTTNKKVEPVGKRNANAWGLHDMNGNVGEWCSDSYEENYYAKSPECDPENTADNNGNFGVKRGGSCDDPAESCRSANREKVWKDEHNYNLGLRIIVVPR
ncbi:MAG: formylglycine-generating enzyme family protein [Thermoguttaceae bacterium]|nr:formylglycine-generating enzyme family protein [Thermoguttaceae bacterium]